MLGLFISSEGVSVVEGDSIFVAPEMSTSPHTGLGRFKLLATDTVTVDDAAQVLAFYEEQPIPEWERAIRRESEATK